MKVVERSLPFALFGKLSIVFAIASALALLGIAIDPAAVPAQSLGTSSTFSQFQTCVLGLQGKSKHFMTLAEARQCGPGLPEIKRSEIEAIGESGQLPSVFLAVWGNHAAIQSTGVPDAQLVAFHSPSQTVFTSCYNTWTYPDPSFWQVLDWGNLSSGGYGNHCGYANVPSNPTYATGCAGCNQQVKSVGHADSNWDLQNWGIQSALAWGNDDFYFDIKGIYSIDSWYCRAWVNTSGGQSPSAWCR